MKSDIHPKWYNNAKITCSCGEEFTTGSTLESFHADICSACHPFYTGEMRFVDVQGRVEKFQAKQKQAEGYSKTISSKKASQTKKQQESARSLKEVLTQMKKDVKPESPSKDKSTSKN